MSDDLLDLQWKVPTSGFRCVKGEPVQKSDLWKALAARYRYLSFGVGWYLVGNTVRETPAGLRSYNPFAISPPLFRTFAYMTPTKEDVLEFASKFGSLGIGIPIKVRDPGVKVRQQLIGESLANWKAEIARMRDIVQLWEMCEKFDIDGLSEHIEWEENSVTFRRERDNAECRQAKKNDTPDVIVHRKPLINGVREPSKGDEWFERFMPGDVLLPALVYLQKRINTYLQEMASPRLLWDLGGISLNLRFHPESLLSLLWMQLAGEVSDKIPYRECPMCRRWVRVGRHAARTNRLYCSTACRMRGLRRRQELARSLHQQGTPIEAVATELHSKVDAILRWVGPTKEERF